MSGAKTHNVTIANRGGHVLPVREDQTILDVCEENGLPLPVACRYGGCITCAGRLLSGSVRQPKGTALNHRQSQAGYILMCVAHPKENCVVEVGVESHGDLYQNPFSVVRPPLGKR
ncbi:MAG: 2Fe-2S iron-sulfur cluster binding domain-containing protein [Hyphomicrobiales bacterium]|nr:2Fe-2S iron-sulfur cluster binding domain-containing protein [Hyphomicrobiales bacterium]